ncbi:Tyrosine-protein kinase YwqD [Botrimarina colliarenosi]|uniref:non-specific protein-tyrosine kinase n=1 Tax=Botrimarina colliarenosi TaxID=2528001 RepID=A0A5C6AA28_9BACT|nr:polysaccharide biosynthesis tyrosine autokinase [Botrimarina colliarenosi]TWT96168.1 Tyrosine-protein kinase YwqD [Botrimarina colliarenosi]
MALPPSAPASTYAMTPSSASLPAPGMIIDQDEDAGGVNVAAIAWQSRWLILLFTLLGGLASWLYLQRVVPRYTSLARVFVEQNLPRALNGDALGTFSNKYLFTQAELIRSSSVLSAAVEAPENAALETFRKTDNPVGLLRESLEVAVGERDDIINIAIELENPTDAAVIVNSVVDAYITQYAEERRTNVVDVVNILRSEKQRRDDELESRRKALESFRQEHVSLAIQSKEGNVVNELFSALSQELNATQIQLLESKTRYARAKKMLENPDQAPFLMELARSAHSNSRGSDLEGQIQSVEQSLVSQQTKWGPGYPSVRLLQDSLDKLRSKQAEQQQAILNAYVDGLRQDYELLTQRRDELQRAYDKQFALATAVSQQAAKLDALQEAHDRTARMCDILDERIKEVNLSEEVGAMNVSILEVAGPGMQTFPDRPKTLSLGLAFGAMLGFGLAWLRNLLDHRLKSIEEIASVMQLPIVGAVPLVTGARSREGERNIGGRIVALQPRSVAAEAIRALRTSLHFGLAGDARTYVVTSPAPGDGKSTVASNLAIAMAQANQRVLLIDADMRKPTQHEIFGVEVESGFAAVLSGVTPAIEAVVATSVPSLDLLACGRIPASPVELLNNGNFSEALEQLSRHYDQIIIDSPPVMPVADARLISAMVDCSLLVLRAERSTRRISVSARDELLKVRTQRLGVIVNAAPLHRASYGGYYAYGYGSNGQVAYGGEVAPEPAPSRRRLLKQDLEPELGAVDS